MRLKNSSKIDAAFEMVTAALASVQAEKNRIQYNLDWGIFSLIEFIGSSSKDIGERYQSCIDIGSGAGVQTEILKHAGLNVFQLDKYSDIAEYKVDFIDHVFDQKFDVVFCSHVIEHQRNVGNFLDKVHDILNDDGVLIISAPKHSAQHMVQGHLNCFTTPYFIQHLVHAGFDLKNGKYLSCGSIENAAIVSKDPMFDFLERKQDGHTWTVGQKARSFIDLRNQCLEKFNPYFYNCDIVSLSPENVISLNFPAGYKDNGININSPRWNIDITF